MTWWEGENQIHEGAEIENSPLSIIATQRTQADMRGEANHVVYNMHSLRCYRSLAHSQISGAQSGGVPPRAHSGGTPSALLCCLPQTARPSPMRRLRHSRRRVKVRLVLVRGHHLLLGLANVRQAHRLAANHDCDVVCRRRRRRARIGGGGRLGRRIGRL